MSHSDLLQRKSFSVVLVFFIGLGLSCLPAALGAEEEQEEESALTAAGTSVDELP